MTSTAKGEQSGTGSGITPPVGTPHALPSSKEAYLGFLKDQIKDLNENLKTTLTLYTTWYNFFITLNAAALAFASDKGPRFAVALVFLVLNVLGGASCLLVRSSAIDTIIKLNISRDELWRNVVRQLDGDGSAKSCFFETLSANLVSWSVIGNFLGVVLFEVIWLCILVGFGFPK